MREATRSPDRPASRLVISSVSPSAKYWSSADPRFLNGSTAMVRRSDEAEAGRSGDPASTRAITAPPPARTSAASAASATRRRDAGRGGTDPAAAVPVAVSAAANASAVS